jgi:16S rRNA (uracil1498-N3)-methyltransferase
VLALSGPEGGLTEQEEAAARAAGFVPVSLGPRVLRADTAPLALLAWLALSAAPSPPPARSA